MVSSDSITSVWYQLILISPHSGIIWFYHLTLTSPDSDITLFQRRYKSILRKHILTPATQDRYIRPYPTVMNSEFSRLHVVLRSHRRTLHPSLFMLIARLWHVCWQTGVYFVQQRRQNRTWPPVRDPHCHSAEREVHCSIYSELFHKIGKNLSRLMYQFDHAWRQQKHRKAGVLQTTRHSIPEGRCEVQLNRSSPIWTAMELLRNACVSY